MKTLNYDELAAHYEGGVDWRSWPQTNDKDVLEMRLAALRYREAECSLEAQKLHVEGERLSELLMAL
jgi:hypothetical protein